MLCFREPLVMAMSPSPQVPEAVQEKVKALIACTSLGPLTKWSMVVDVLIANKMAYKVEHVSCNDLVVHPENRAKLGVNPYNAHRVGSYIKQVGADFAELANATAFELSPMTNIREKQLEFNKKLIEHSGGMLAPLSGGERYLTVSCGHTAAFCKAVLGQCRTPQSSLANSDGVLNLDHVAKGDWKLRSMIQDGWTWLIISWQVEAVFRELPDLAQRALNASNSVASLSTELEVASSIAEFASLQGAQGKIDWDSCIAAAGATAPPCKPYIHVIAEYTKKFGGGTGAPMIKYLDTFSKTFGESKILGVEFLTAVVEANLSGSPLEMYPHIRTGLLATNLVSTKIVDGIARLLTKSDVQALAKKEKRQEVKSTESMLGDCWCTAVDFIEHGHVTFDKVCLLLGRLHTRSILHLVGKGKIGPEKRVFDSIGSILQCFRDEFVKSLPEGIKPPTVWSEVKVDSLSDVASSSAPPNVMLQLGDLSDPVRVCKSLGYEVGKHYVHKQTKLIVKLVDVSPTGCTVIEHNMGIGEPQRFSLQAVSVCSGKELAIFKGQLPTKLDPELCTSKLIAESNTFAVDLKRQGYSVLPCSGSSLAGLAAFFGSFRVGLPFALCVTRLMHGIRVGTPCGLLRVVHVGSWTGEPHAQTRALTVWHGSCETESTANQTESNKTSGRRCTNRCDTAPNICKKVQALPDLG